jgi:hypothetical protein
MVAGPDRDFGRRIHGREAAILRTALLERVVPGRAVVPKTILIARFVWWTAALKTIRTVRFVSWRAIPQTGRLERLVYTRPAAPIPFDLLEQGPAKPSHRVTVFVDGGRPENPSPRESVFCVGDHPARRFHRETGACVHRHRPVIRPMSVSGPGPPRRRNRGAGIGIHPEPGPPGRRHDQRADVRVDPEQARDGRRREQRADGGVDPEQARAGRPGRTAASVRSSRWCASPGRGPRDPSAGILRRRIMAPAPS